jgi:divalent metal cation (Fe/Co/Zn/Cd) transporter
MPWSTPPRPLYWSGDSEPRTPGTPRARSAPSCSRLRIAGTAFLLVALYLVVQATRSLSAGRHFDATLFGIGEAVASLLVLPILASAKFSLSWRLGSRALRADSLLTWSGVALASLTLAALLAQRLLGWWWADPTGALGIAVVLAWQGTRAIRDYSGLSNAYG